MSILTDPKEAIGRDGLATTTDGKVMMVYTGETPWHGLGTKFDSLMTTVQAVNGAMMPEVEEIPAFYEWNGKRFQSVDKKVIVRKDNGQYISTVGKDYKVLQFSEALGDTMDGLIGEGNAMIETAGIIRNGAIGWMQAKLPGDIVIEGSKGKDILQRYILASTSHDGSRKTEYATTLRRVVCRNTLRAARESLDKGSVTVRHTKNAEKRLSKVGSLLADANEFYAKFAHAANLMSVKAVTEQIAKDYLSLLVPDKKDAKNTSRTENIRAEILNLANAGMGNDMDGVKGSLWALYNGATEYADYHRGTRGENETERKENRLESVFFGSGVDFKEKAFELAYEMAK